MINPPFQSMLLTNIFAAYHYHHLVQLLPQQPIYIIICASFGTSFPASWVRLLFSLAYIALFAVYHLLHLVLYILVFVLIHPEYKITFQQLVWLKCNVIHIYNAYLNGGWEIDKYIHLGIVTWFYVIFAISWLWFGSYSFCGICLLFAGNFKFL